MSAASSCFETTAPPSAPRFLEDLTSASQVTPVEAWRTLPWRQARLYHSTNRPMAAWHDSFLMRARRSIFGGQECVEHISSIAGAGLVALGANTLGFGDDTPLVNFAGTIDDAESGGGLFDGRAAIPEQRLYRRGRCKRALKTSSRESLHSCRMQCSTGNGWILSGDRITCWRRSGRSLRWHHPHYRRQRRVHGFFRCDFRLRRCHKDRQG